MFAIRFKYAARKTWTYCIEMGQTLTFESKAEAESFADQCRKAVKGLNLGHVYEVVEL